MKITNKTHYRTDDLRKLFVACVNHHGGEIKRMSITVLYGEFSGFAYYPRHELHGGTITVRLPSPKRAPEGLKMKWLTNVAQLFEHELMHCFGIRHGDMDRDVYNCRQDVSAWLPADLPKIRAQSGPKVPTEEEKATAKEANARAKLAEWERKAKLAKTRLKKWKAEVRRYDRKHKAAGGNP